MIHQFDIDSDICENCGMTAFAIEEYAVQCGQKWERCGTVIRSLHNGVIDDFPSINAAKRASRKLQGKKLGYAGMRVGT